MVFTSLMVHDTPDGIEDVIDVFGSDRHQYRRINHNSGTALGDVPERFDQIVLAIQPEDRDQIGFVDLLFQFEGIILLVDFIDGDDDIVIDRGLNEMLMVQDPKNQQDERFVLFQFQQIGVLFALELNGALFPIETEFVTDDAEILVEIILKRQHEIIMFLVVLFVPGKECVGQEFVAGLGEHLFLWIRQRIELVEYHDFCPLMI